MRRKLKAVYVYNSQTDKFTEYYDLIYDRVVFSQQFDGVGDRIYGVNYANKIRIEVAKHAEEIFHNRLNHEYVVYLNKPNRIHAAELISDHILYKNEMDISYHEKRLDKLKARHKQFEKFKEQYVTEPTKIKEELLGF